MRLLLVCSILGLIGAAGCTRTSTVHDAGSATDMGTPAVDVGGDDAASTSCTSDGQCNDSIACTLDQCVVGNVCMHTPIDGMCTGAGEHCSATLGCTTMTTTTCNTDAECDDHVFCNGDESCVLHSCFHDPAGRNCNDGNDCTVDSCDEALSGCSYMPVCDSGIVTTDAGPTCTAFVSPTDFAGTYSIVPTQSQACGGANYDISEVTISVAGGTVTVVTGTSGSMTLTGSMTAADSFDVTRTSGSNTFHLTGTFACRERFMGHWTATLSGFGCVNQDVDVRGSRR